MKLLAALMIIATLAFLSSVSVASQPPQLFDQLEVGQVVFASDFSTPVAAKSPQAKKLFSARQSTQWEVKEGVLHGQPSTEEFQRSHKDHQGFEPRVTLLSTSKLHNYAVRFSFRLNDGEQTKLGSFFEFGHHVARVTMKSDGVILHADHESITLAEDPTFKLETGTWYHVDAAVFGDQVCVQFRDGPTLKARHETILNAETSLGFCGLKGGTMDLDDVTVWALKE